MHTKSSKQAKSTRYEANKSRGMPPVNGADYVVSMAMECGIHSLTWRELEAWKNATGTRLSAWEACAIMRMANAYTSALSEYSEKTVASPWVSEEIDRDKVANDVRSALRRRR